MKIKLVAGEPLDFTEVKLSFGETNITNKFTKYKNRTLGGIFKNRRYSSLKVLFEEDLAENSETKLGTFLSSLKGDNDDRYLCFLNKYGNDQFCNFYIVHDGVKNKKGLYCYMVNDEIKYVGRCTDNFSKRVNSGYGTISPKNCYKDGQSTNCRINSLLNKADISKDEEVKFYICEMEDIDEIKLKEKILLCNNYEWNIQ